VNGFTLGVDVPAGYDETVAATRTALADEGLGVLTEIDLQATMKAKLDVDISPQVILGACRPQLAHRALEADPTIAALLPCNVVVRAVDAHSTRVEAFDPHVMMAMTSSDAVDATLTEVAHDARTRLEAALAALSVPSSASKQEN
jgi:uncharacterized protein (DUF302 family)